MTSRATYVLRVHGRLRGAPGDNRDAEDEFRRLFERPDGPDPTRTGKWPDGLWLEGYEICHWRASVEPAARDYTLLDFRAEVNSIRSGQLYDNRDAMLQDVSWFYQYAEQNWHMDLVQQLSEFNSRRNEIIVDELWFRDWQWYCGNGGGM
jgi:hypothetical protein